MSRRPAYLNHDPDIRAAIANTARAARRAEETLTNTTHQLTDVERADLTDAIARLTRLADLP